MDDSSVRLFEITFKEGDMYVSYNPELDISSCGKTIPEAKKNLSEALIAFIKEAREMGTLEDILSEQGFKLKSTGWNPPEIVDTDSLDVSISAGA
jgi:predicted RNase H-like HicB family nuclease